MIEMFKAEEIEIGYHPEGYRIDKTASAMNRYTKWRISPDGLWKEPAPACFHSMPTDGWYKSKGFDWDQEMNV